MGTGEMPLLVPVTLSVSASISCRTSSKSVNFLDLQCKNSAYSEKKRKKVQDEKEALKKGGGMELHTCDSSCS
jgi:hypothetical protein